MCDLEAAARCAMDWVEDSYPLLDVPEEGRLALLISLALGGFYYEKAVEDNDQLRLTGDPSDIDAAVDIDMRASGFTLGCSGFLSFKHRYPDWRAKLCELIDRLEEIRPNEEDQTEESREATAQPS
jgi:hypothetical protein